MDAKIYKTLCRVNSSKGNMECSVVKKLIDWSRGTFGFSFTSKVINCHI